VFVLSIARIANANCIFAPSVLASKETWRVSSTSNQQLMRAVVLRAYGGPEQLSLESMPKAARRSERELLVRVHAANIASGDWRVNTLEVPGGALGRFAVRLLFGWSGPRRQVRGISGSGVVVEAGAKVRNFAVGDRVYFINSMAAGALGDFVALAPTGMLMPAVVAKIPAAPARPIGTPKVKKGDSLALAQPAAQAEREIPEIKVPLSFAEAAPLAFGAMSAFHFINEQTLHRPGMHVLVYGAAGAVGSYAVQLAKWYGANVTAVARATHHPSLLDLGANRVIDYTETDFRNELVGDGLGAKYDLVFDAVMKGKIDKKSCQRVLASGGKFLTIASPTSEDPKKLQALNSIIEQGGLRTLLDKVYPLEEYREAHEHVYAGHKQGNVVVEIVGAGTE